MIINKKLQQKIIDLLQINTNLEALQIAQQAMIAIIQIVEKQHEATAIAMSGAIDNNTRLLYNNKFQTLHKNIDYIAKNTIYEGYNLINGDLAKSSNDELEIEIPDLSSKALYKNCDEDFSLITQLDAYKTWKCISQVIDWLYSQQAILENNQEHFFSLHDYLTNSLHYVYHYNINQNLEYL